MLTVVMRRPALDDIPFSRGAAAAVLEEAACSGAARGKCVKRGKASSP